MLPLMARFSYEEEMVFFCFFFPIFKLMLDKAISNTPKKKSIYKKLSGDYLKILLIAIH